MIKTYKCLNTMSSYFEIIVVQKGTKYKFTVKIVSKLIVFKYTSTFSVRIFLRKNEEENNFKK